MRKKKLNPETLDVQGFEPAPRPEARNGTVHGYITGAFGPACASDWPNCIDNTASGVYGPQCVTEVPNC